jgi:hypothetical protein
MWKIKAFTADFKRTIVQEWFLKQDEAVQNAFEVRLKFVIAQPPEIWQRPYVGTLRKECKGLHEIRFEVGNVQYRPVGYFSGEKGFTILVIAEERGGKFDPKNTCDTAKKRKAMIERNEEYAREFTF